MYPVFEGVFGFRGLVMGRAYAVQDPDGLTLIDAGLGWRAGTILKQLTAAGHPLSSVKRILITHAHIDHGGGAHRIQQATGAALMVSALEADSMRGAAELPRPRDHRVNVLPRQFFKPAEVTRELNDGDLIADVMGGLIAVATPGHTLGHLSFWSPSRKLLFTGDVVLHTLGISFPLEPVTVSMAKNRESVRKIAALEPEIMLFGHGSAITSGAAERLHDFIKRRGL